MNIYIIEHEIIVLLNNMYVDGEKAITNFSIDGIEFSHWDFTYGKGTFGERWLGKMEIESENYLEAIKIYHKKLSRIIPKISLIGQAYIDSQRGSLLIKKGNYGFLRYIYSDNPVSLSFGIKEKNILTDLIENNNIPESFYFYWNELMNTDGYLAKILIIGAALDSLFTKNERKNGRIKILGEKLANELYKSGEKGLRHRLTHGVYFSPEDFQKNYVEEIHKKVIEYFNNEVITINEKITQGIVNPQRHLYSNYKIRKTFLKFDNNISLKDILSEIKNNDLSTLKYQRTFTKPENF